jgi:hypothetical protein
MLLGLTITIPGGLLFWLALAGSVLFLGLSWLEHDGDSYAPMLLPLLFWVGYFVCWLGWFR